MIYIYIYIYINIYTYIYIYIYSLLAIPMCCLLMHVMCCAERRGTEFRVMGCRRGSYRDTESRHHEADNCGGCAIAGKSAKSYITLCIQTNVLFSFIRNYPIRSSALDSERRWRSKHICEWSISSMFFIF